MSTQFALFRHTVLGSLTESVDKGSRCSHGRQQRYRCNRPHTQGIPLYTIFLDVSHIGDPNIKRAFHEDNGIMI